MSNEVQGRCPVDYAALSQRKTTRSHEPAGKPVERDASGVWHVRGHAQARVVLRSADTKQAGFNAELLERMPQKMRPPILYQEGQPHHEQRRQTARFFSPKAVSANYRGLMEELADGAIRELLRERRADLTTLSMGLAVGVAGRVVGLTESRLPGMTRRLDAFFEGDMTGFGWSLVDVGTAQGALPVQVARAHGHLSGGGFDLPPIGPFFEEYVQSYGLGDRLRFYPGDFFEDPLPAADVLVMGRILHDWDLEEKMMLLGKAYEALPEDGALIVYESIIDDDRRENALGLLMSLNMLIETPGGFDFTGADCHSWMSDVGFREAYVEHLVGPSSMVVGIK